MKKGKFKTVMEGVKALLCYDKAARDNDDYLEMLYHWKEMGSPENISFNDYARMRREKKLTSAQTITRARRKLQEQFPILRGRNWALRKRQQVYVRNWIKD